jgi:putative ABC transport system permease protein
MRRVALKGIWFRRVRAALTGLAVVLGVAMISGTYVVTDTVTSAFNGIFNTSYKTSSVVISGRQLVSGATSGVATLPQSLVVRVRATAGVETAAGAIFSLQGRSDEVKLLDRNGKTLGNQNAPKFGFGISPSDARFNPLTLVRGQWAAGPDQVVLDKGTADSAHLTVGDRVEAQGTGAARSFAITGVARFGSIDSLGGATIAVFNVPAAQALLGKIGRLDTIFVAAEPGVAGVTLVRSLRPLLTAGAQVQTAAAQARSDSKDIRAGTKIIQTFLLVFGLIALGVGAFVIFNTLSITIAQRVREIATLRSLGASRRQVMRSVLIEGFAIGVVAAVIGLFVGLALAKGLEALFNALGASLPHASMVLKPRTVIVSLAVGIIVTVLATVSPARRATQIAPVAAVQEGATLPPRLGARHPVIPRLMLILAAVLLLAGAFAGASVGTSLELLGGGGLLLVVGVSMIAARLVPSIVKVVGAPARRLGDVPGRLAGRNALRNPTRTATTAAALMIGLALVTLVATLASGLRASDRAGLKAVVNSDYVLTSRNDFDSFSTAADTRLARVPAVRSVVAVRQDNAAAFGKTIRVDGVGPGASQVLNLRWSTGSDRLLDTLGPSGAVIEQGFARDHHLQLGSAFTIRTGDGRTANLRVRGIVAPRSIEKIDPVLGPVVISQAAFDGAFARPQDILTLVRTNTGATPTTTRALTAALVGFNDTRIRTQAGWVTQRSNGINKLLDLLYILLALSVVVSLFGMINALVLTVFERTREIGMLRAAGMSRRQVRRMVRHEGVITALIGAALGLPLGLVIAALITRALSPQGVTFSVPLTSLVIFTLVAVLAGVLAAIAPARRASRLNVLTALHYE